MTTHTLKYDEKAPIPEEKLHEMYHYLLLTRTIENQIDYICANQTKANPFLIGKGYLSIGQEAISVGAACTIGEKDWFAQSHRDLAAHLIRGVTPLEIFLQYRCTSRSPTQGKEGNVHFGPTDRHLIGFTSHMGQNLAIALGTAWASQYRGEDAVTLTACGEGASQQGVVHESMNYAAVFKLPVVFIINNNGWAISVPVKEQMIIEDVADRAAGYGMPATVVDGNDVMAVYRAVKAGVDRARKGEGPCVIECKTFRMTGHGTHDPATYVPKADKEKWAKHDPIDFMKNYLISNKLWDEDRDQKLRAEIKKTIDVAVNEAATDVPPDPSVAVQGVWSDPSIPVE
ncbi:MAG: pyruvate dehydrogenase [Deltaproteobacteria bacterium CG11_big_fil_rev_8_21_14_0_20_47_16]|nr:MAG: pyruvate dehydrogenase [Deltaproteobacteria bacterium CG11_big_fil_rev_8_21_14_0_20_47_16]